MKRKLYDKKIGRFKRDYDVEYKRFGRCCICRENKENFYSTILAGWRCWGCEPQTESKNFMRKR